MKREGRQHGMVRTYKMLPSPWNPTPSNNSSKFMNRLDDSSPPTAGLFSKVQFKPTDHSKFTGKCGRPRCNGCRMPPCYKAKDKIKGSNRRRPNDVVPNYKLSGWRVADGGPWLNHLSGSSATRILDHLALQDYMDGDDGYDYDRDHDHDYDCDTPVRNCLLETLVGCGPPSPGMEIREIASAFDDDDNDKGHGDRDEDVDDEYEDGGMSFCVVGFVLEQLEGDEDWCLVEEM